MGSLRSVERNSWKNNFYKSRHELTFEAVNLPFHLNPASNRTIGKKNGEAYHIGDFMNNLV